MARLRFVQYHNKTMHTLSVKEKIHIEKSKEYVKQLKRHKIIFLSAILLAIYLIL